MSCTRSLELVQRTSHVFGQDLPYRRFQEARDFSRYGRGRQNVISLNAGRCLGLVVGGVRHGGLHGDCPSYVSLECTKTSLTFPLRGAIAITKHVDSWVSQRKDDQTRVTLHFHPLDRNAVVRKYGVYNDAKAILIRAIVLLLGRRQTPH